MTETPTAGRILIVDDDPAVATMLERLLTEAGFETTIADSGASALEAVEQGEPDVVLLDLVMPGMSGLEVCRRLKQGRSTRLTPVVVVTGHADRQHRLQALEAGSDDVLLKPVDPAELRARVRSYVRLKRYTDDLDSATSIIMTFAVLIEGRDGCTDGHCHRMANYAAALGRRLGLPEADIRTLYRGGFLHDIGKLAVPDELLRKPGPLSPQEFEIIKSHTVIGEALCGNLRSLRAVRPIVRHHHERLDGSGYPDGLRGDEVPLAAQIVGLVDVFDAVTTKRPYKNAYSAEEAFDVLRAQVERGWRAADLVEAFIDLVRSGTVGHFGVTTGRAAQLAVPRRSTFEQAAGHVEEIR
ncbi:MAG TPA: HD domain-containing phosphohydrolase [Vicinamibacterales bacterium]|nr:HD domain-containing phosphohydrolase [Vicinamibacterales bacterium]